MFIKLEDYFTFYSKEVVRTRPNFPYIAGRVCKDVACKHKQRNESHYHCKFCEYVRRGRQSERMEKHLISKHSRAIGLVASPGTKGGEKSENGRYSVLDHSYTNGEAVLSANSEPPTMLMLPDFSDKETTISPNANSHSKMENQENEHQLNALVTSKATIVNKGNWKAIASSLATTNSKDMPNASNPFAPKVIGEGGLSDQHLLESLASSLPSSQGLCLVASKTNGSICIVPKCTHSNSKLKTLMRMKQQGSRHSVDWESTMLLLTFFKIDKVNDITNKCICSVHWKDWYNFNYRLKKNMPRYCDATTQTFVNYL